MRGPEGVDLDASVDVVRDALLQPVAGPALPDHVVPGDRVVIAQAGNLPGGQVLSDAIYRAILQSLQAGGVSPEDIQLVIARPTIQSDDSSLTDDSSCTTNQPFPVNVFNPLNDGETAYLLADDITEVSKTSKSYFIEETDANEFEVYFGDGKIGNKPVNNNIVIISYYICNGTLGNDISSFSDPLTSLI